MAITQLALIDQTVRINQARIQEPILVQTLAPAQASQAADVQTFLPTLASLLGMLVAVTNPVPVANDREQIARATSLAVSQELGQVQVVIVPEAVPAMAVVMQVVGTPVAVTKADAAATMPRPT